MFFKAKPNVGDNDKAKIEFFFDRASRCLGVDRITKPIVRLDELISLGLSSEPIAKIVSFVSTHLAHQFDDLTVDLAPKLVQKCGGGG
jgi:hypothetical protein